jgi:hypothetical protein
MEVVMMEYSISGFIPVILAAVAGTTINQLVFGSGSVFHPPQGGLRSLLELPVIALAGLVIATFAAVFIRMQAFSSELSLNKPVIVRFALAGLLAGSVAIFAPEIMGVGYDTIDSALAGHMGLWLLFGILTAKLVVTAVSLGVGIPGGVIGPLLYMGACIGGIVGIVANQLMPNEASEVGFYVILGMGAMMGAALNAPLAAMVAILELTYNPQIIFPSMLMTVVACLGTKWLFGCDGLFQTLLAVQGKKNNMAPNEQLLSRSGVRSLLDKHIRITENAITYGDAQQLLAHHPHWIVLREQKLLLNPSDLALYLSENPATPDTLLDLLTIPARRLDMIELDDRTNLYQALLSMNQAQVDAAYVPITSKPGLGIITRTRLDNYYKLQN